MNNLNLLVNNTTTLIQGSDFNSVMFGKLSIALLIFLMLAFVGKISSTEHVLEKSSKQEKAKKFNFSNN